MINGNGAGGSHEDQGVGGRRKRGKGINGKVCVPTTDNKAGQKHDAIEPDDGPDQLTGGGVGKKTHWWMKPPGKPLSHWGGC